MPEVERRPPQRIFASRKHELVEVDDREGRLSPRDELRVAPCDYLHDQREGPHAPRSRVVHEHHAAVGMLQKLLPEAGSHGLRGGDLPVVGVDHPVGGREVARSHGPEAPRGGEHAERRTHQLGAMTRGLRDQVAGAVDLEGDLPWAEVAENNVVVGVVAQQVTAADDLAQEVSLRAVVGRVAVDAVADHEERRVDVMLVEHVEEPRRRENLRAVVEGEREAAAEARRAATVDVLSAEERAASGRTRTGSGLRGQDDGEESEEKGRGEAGGTHRERRYALTPWGREFLTGTIRA